MGRISPELGKSTSRTGAFVATALIVAGWSYFILTGNISTIWPMFGIANQLLACTALCVGTTILLREAKKKSYALITIAPLLFVGNDDDRGGHPERAEDLPSDARQAGDVHDGRRERDRDVAPPGLRDARDRRQRDPLLGPLPRAASGRGGRGRVVRPRARRPEEGASVAS